MDRLSFLPLVYTNGLVEKEKIIIIHAAASSARCIHADIRTRVLNIFASESEISTATPESEQEAGDF